MLRTNLSESVAVNSRSVVAALLWWMDVLWYDRVLYIHTSINRVLKQGLLDKPFSQFYVFQYNTIMDSLTKSADLLVPINIVELVLAVISL